MNDTGRFTMPGEAGYESLTLELARKWGADVIRDSDGTTLSDEILDAGYGIYSTVCLIRDHNEWAAAHPHALQQTFLMTQPVAATGDTLTIDLMKDFFAEQFRINGDGDAMPYWQVYDRTENRLLPAESWTYRPEEGAVKIRGASPVPYLHRELPRLPHLGRDLHVQPHHEPLGQGASHADRPHPPGNAVVSARLDAQLV